ncbi:MULTISPECIES: Imm10 family immunity protein [unclassified Streptomyces]|uniref:Imm10 family immunity protein n=1 Tax=unclassified Streptomyces TaxID=2593676 RepID=UPI0006FD9F9C|nr:MULTISPECIES: Imm10 family immunity protein [unclassified Streptomyces]KQX59462.1 hypothetical protein ASD33_04085 [Streptomyces sp. Root1304]KRB00721.1 hypothetical protein ASE09_04090 [Streptomyces sp. Root66D1]
MTYRFTARAVAAEADVEGEMQAGVAEEDEGFFLLFTRALGEPSAQDVPLGLDTYQVTTPDECTAYGCVREATLTDTSLTVTLDPACLDDLELDDTTIEAVLDVPAESIAELRTVLAKVLTSGREESHPLLTGFPT